IFVGSISRKHSGFKPSCQVSGRRSIFLGIEIRTPGMNEMNGSKFLQEQAHGRGKNNQRARYHESFRRWSENLIAMNEQRKAMIGRELLERAAKLGVVAM